MLRSFDAQNPPFDRLSHAEADELRASLDVVYFRPGDVIIEAGQPSDALHTILKGAVEERDGETLAAVLGPRESFDARALVHGAAGARFVAAEETLTYVAPKPVVLDLIRRNPGFAAFFYAEISRKLDAMARKEAGEGVDSVLFARIRDARFRPAVFIEGGESIEAAGHLMRERDTNALFVRDGDRLGIVTGMNLSKGVVLKRLPLETPVREVSHFDIVAVDADDFLFEALILMTRHNKRRLAVRADGCFTGVLEDIDLLGLFAGNSQLIPGRIDRARAPDDLAGAARDIQEQVDRLHRQGVRVAVIAEITSDLNRALMAKLFELTAPPSIADAGCLVVMGSEGRGEQTVRTDQDNGLILASPVPEAELAAFREAFSGALARFGFPPCPGGVMVSNPLWSQPLDGFVRQIRHWVTTPDADAAMNLAIFADAVPVAGRASLAAAAKQALFDALRGESAALAHFARAIDLFAGGPGMFSSLMATVGLGVAEIDLKKTGVFPIVHGIRTMAVEKGITETATSRRIEALAAAGVFGADFGRELAGALHVLMGLRLRSQLAAVKRGTTEGEALVRPSELSTVDRDLLREALRLVKQFREMVRNRYNLGLF